MKRRQRSTAVLATLFAGALALIASTQTWFTVVLDDGSATALAVPGADAVAVLAPLSLAILAAGAALSIAGRILASILAVVAAASGVVLLIVTVPLLFGDTLGAVASTVTEATGLAGRDAVADLVADTSATAWPVLGALGAAVAVLAGVFVLATARRWTGTGRRYRSTSETGVDAGRSSSAHASATDDRHESGGRPVRERDAIDDWDDLSHGQDPTR